MHACMHDHMHDHMACMVCIHAFLPCCLCMGVAGCLVCMCRDTHACVSTACSFACQGAFQQGLCLCVLSPWWALQAAGSVSDVSEELRRLFVSFVSYSRSSSDHASWSNGCSYSAGHCVSFGCLCCPGSWCIQQLCWRIICCQLLPICLPDDARAV